MKQTSIYRAKGNWYILPSSLTTEGVWIACDPVSIISEDADPIRIGELILEALSKSKEGEPHPLFPFESRSSIRKAVGVRSWNELEKTTQLVTVTLDGDNRATITPWKRAEVGCIPLTEKETVISGKLSSTTLAREVAIVLKCCA